MIKIKNTKILTCNRDCNFHWSKLPKMLGIMSEKILNLYSANLCYADLRNITLCNANLCNADLSYANLSNVDLVNANLIDAILCNVDLSSANLCGANLYGANLRYVDLYDANLCNTNLCNTNLCGANLCSAKLKPLNDKEVIIKDFMTVTGLGSVNRQTIIFDTNIGIVIQCGCFYGTEKEFKKKVKEVHKDTNYEKEYLEMIKLAKIRFSRSI